MLRFAGCLLVLAALLVAPSAARGDTPDWATIKERSNRPRVGVATPPGQVKRATVKLLSNASLGSIKLGEQVRNDGYKPEWRAVPDELEGAPYTRTDRHHGITSFRVESPGWILLVCDTVWGRPPGHGSGDWSKEVVPKEAFKAAGWEAVDIEILIAGPDTPLEDIRPMDVYARYCDAGEVFRVRTTKYWAPILVLPDFAPGSKWNAAKGSATVDIRSKGGLAALAPGAPLAEEGRRSWGSIPRELIGSLFQQTVSDSDATLDFKVKQAGDVYVACRGADFGPSPTLREELDMSGWKPARLSLTSSDRRLPGRIIRWEVFVRDCEEDDHFIMTGDDICSMVMIMRAGDGD